MEENVRNKINKFLRSEASWKIGAGMMIAGFVSVFIANNIFLTILLVAAGSFIVAEHTVNDN